MQKLIYTLLITLAFSFSAHATEPGNFTPLNPAFEAWRAEIKEKQAQRTNTMQAEDPVQDTAEGYRVLGKRPSPVNLRHLHDQSIVSETRTALDADPVSQQAYFDLRDEGWVSGVKNQDPWGTCWSFAAIGSAESSALKNELLETDFSEKHLAWFAYNDMDAKRVAFDIAEPEHSVYEEGGSGTVSMAMYSRWTGPVSESDVPYEDFDTPPPADADNAALVNTAVIGPSGDSFVSNVKHLLAVYGAVNIDVFVDDSVDDDETYNGSYNPQNAAFYYGGDELGSNHSVLAVGWDDTYAKENFLHTPPGDGAWIVQNSWGEEWGDEGYFYVSYYDKVTGKHEDEMAFVYSVEEPNTYNINHFYDPLGVTGGYAVGDDFSDQWFSNVFTAEEDQYIQAAGVFVLNLDTTVHVSVYTNPWPNNPASGTLALENVTTHKDLPGYYVINFGEDVFIEKGENFSIVVRLETEGDLAEAPIAVEAPIEGYSSKATADLGESFVSADGINWTDMAGIEDVPEDFINTDSDSNNVNVSLKALGKRYISDPEADSGQGVKGSGSSGGCFIQTLSQ